MAQWQRICLIYRRLEVRILLYVLFYNWFRNPNGKGTVSKTASSRMTGVSVQVASEPYIPLNVCFDTGFSGTILAGWQSWLIAAVLKTVER